jgi:site-specific DNA-adenine methylase
MKPLRLFRYSGNKSRLLKFYRKPPEGTRRVVEPYLGSGAYLLNSGLPGLGYEANKDLVGLWNWLRKTNENELRDLAALVQSRKDKPDVRDLKLDHGPQTYIRINVCSVVVGQLSSWKIYPQHRLPVEETIRCLPRLKDIDVIHAGGETHQCEEGDMLFVDPPYVGTVGNYIEKGGKEIERSYDPEDTMRLLECQCPALVTYGTNAMEVFPSLHWELVKTIKVPNMRRGGTVDRKEFVSYTRM